MAPEKSKLRFFFFQQSRSQIVKTDPKKGNETIIVTLSIEIRGRLEELNTRIQQRQIHAQNFSVQFRREEWKNKKPTVLLKKIVPRGLVNK